MGIYGFIAAAGGSLGELIGGVLTQALGWHSVFLLNVPIGLLGLAALALIAFVRVEARACR